MKPIFFPFTSLTKYDVKSLLSFFDSFSYLSTQSADELSLSEPEWFKTLWKEDRSVEPVTLSQEELTPILSSVKSWRSWADANYGKKNQTGYLQAIFREKPYFTSDSDIFAIRSQIETGVDSIKDDLIRKDGVKPDLNKSSERLKRALLFLRLAMIRDLENDSINQQLSSISQLEANIFSELQGEIDSESLSDQDSLLGKEDLLRMDELSGVNDSQWMQIGNIGKEEDRGSLMTEQRVRNWLTFFIAKQGCFNDCLPNLFVTTSRAVIDFLLFVSEKSKLMLDIDNFKVHKEKNSSHAGAWSETFKVEWNKNIHMAIQKALNKSDSSINSDDMNNIDSDLFQVSGNTLTVMLVGVKE